MRILEALPLLGFIGFWVLLCNIIGYTSGWWSLARSYRHNEQFGGKSRRVHNVRLNRSNYGTMTVGADANGLYLAAFFLFRPGHPPLFIPWADVTVTLVKGWFWRKYLEMTFVMTPDVRLQIPEKYGTQIAADANRAWDNKDTSK